MNRMRILAIIAASALLLQGCFLQSLFRVDRAGTLRLKGMVVEIDNGETYVEASIRHVLNILGLGKAFAVSQFKPQGFSMQQYLVLRGPQQGLKVDTAGLAGDTVKVEDLGKGQRRFVWNLSPRVQSFAGQINKLKPEDQNKTFLIVSIGFPGPVDIANTAEVSDNNTYTWRISNAQLTQGVQLQALYRLQ